jgi:ketosteroid isomerase-like protein
MSNETTHETVTAAMQRINEAWLGGRVQDLIPLVHPDIVMVFPNFTGRIQGREAFLAGFRDFCQSAVVREFREYDHQVDVAGDTAVVTFRYEIIYERLNKRYRSTGRDFWIFNHQSAAWIAVWRAMLESEENEIPL